MARKTAWNCLKEILMQGAFSNLILKNLPDSLSNRDKSLVTTLVYGTLQHYDFLSWQWNDLKKKKCSKSLEILINMALYQLFYLDRIPSYAIVNETLNMVDKNQRGFVQAILSACMQRGIKEADQSDEKERLACRTSIPQWIIGLWNSHYGWEKTEKIAEAFQCDGYELVARVNPIKANLSKMKQDSNLQFIDEWALTSSDNLLKSDYFKNGELVIQDYSSQQPAIWLDAKPGERILDACSAPGSKTGMIAAMMNNQGSIIAADLHEHRLALVEEMAKRLGIDIITTKAMDATLAHLVFEKESFDRILLDVPCSGLGVLKRKPDLRYHVQPSDLDEIVKLQGKILDSCSSLLKKEGTLVYSTCTLNQKENSRQVQQFLQTHKDYELIEEKTWFPFEGHQDGFYLAKLLKKSMNCDRINGGDD